MDTTQIYMYIHKHTHTFNYCWDDVVRAMLTVKTKGEQRCYSNKMQTYICPWIYIYIYVCVCIYIYKMCRNDVVRAKLTVN